MITTERLVLRPHDRKDETLSNEVKWLNDPGVTKYSEQRHKRHNLHTQRHFISTACENIAFYQIWLGERHIGGVTVASDPFNLTADMGILIGEKDCWGRGLGVEAWQGAMKAAFCANPGLRKISAGCMGANTAMIRTCLLSGMTKEGVIPKHFLLDGQTTDLVLFGRYA